MRACAFEMHVCAGAHGTLVKLTLERPSRGTVFDPQLGIISYTVELHRNKVGCIVDRFSIAVCHPAPISI